MAQSFVDTWHAAAKTALGLFWTAFWAFGLGYFISSMIQVFVTRQTMREKMSHAGPRSVPMGTFVGFVSSSCSFAALSGTRALFAKGAGLVPSLAFLLTSTNLVIELGIIIGIFLGWQFVAGKYVGGLILILLMWLVIRLTRAFARVEESRANAKKSQGDDNEAHASDMSLHDNITSRQSWAMVARRYVMEWSGRM